MKILMLSPQYRPIVGGYERAAERLSIGLTKLGIGVTVITERRNRQWPSYEQVNGVRVQRLSCVARPRLHVVTSLSSFAWYLLRNGRKFDVWHVHQYGMHAALAVALGRALNRPVIIKSTNTGHQGIEAAVSQLPLAGLIARLIRNVDAYVATSDQAVAEAENFGIAIERIERIPNGVDTVEFRPTSDSVRQSIMSSLGIDAAGVVISVGRLSPQKNTEGLLCAWRAALPTMPRSWILVIVGDGPAKDGVSNAIDQLRIGQSVRLVGAVDDVCQWLAISDVFVLASRTEGLSNAMLEAMSSGVPVVSTRVSGSVETIESSGAGVLVDVGNAEQMARALSQLAWRKDMRKSLGVSGRDFVIANCAVDAVAIKHLALYRRLTSTC